MASILSSNNLILVSTGGSALVCNTESSTIQNIEQPRSLPSEINNETSTDAGSQGKRIPKKGQTSSDHEERHMACAAVSSCGKWLALASSRGQKQLGLWRTSDWSMESARPMSRAASCIRFTPSSSFVIVADKAGDVYRYSVDDPKKEKEWLLGHIAMLLDVVITHDEKYLISCDRDEKIRISCFPNTYNIHGYCLGHDMFVSSLFFLPHNNNILVSTSGDGSLRLWDYLSGKQLHCLDIKQSLKPEDLSEENPLAVKSCTGMEVDANTSLLCVCIGGLPTCAVFRIENNSDADWTSSLVQKLQLQSELWSLTLTPSGNLYTLSNNEQQPVRAWSWNKQQFVESPQLYIDALNGHTDILKSCFTNPSVPSLLYRRKYADDGDSAVPIERPVKILKS